MSSTSTLVDQRHFAYLAARTATDDEFLLGLKHAALQAGLPEIWISAEQASFMQILLKLSGATEVIEVGTLAGYSAIVMARALRSTGRVHTIELEEVHVAFAREWIKKSEVSQRITVEQGAGLDALRGLPDASFDACFIDADKVSYRFYLEEMKRILRPGSLVMADNAFAFGELFDQATVDPDVPAIRAFNDYMASQDWIQSIIVPVGDGLWVGHKR